MKSMMIILIGILVVGMAGTALGLDAPHNATNSINCGDCHLAPGFGFGGTSTDQVCLSCHVNTSGGGYTKTTAPFVKTHSSANTSSKYGNWSFLCRSCHEPHTQFQRLPTYIGGFAPQSYLATGTISSIDTITSPGKTIYGFSGLTITRPEWTNLATWGSKSGNNRGLLFWPNPAVIGPAPDEGQEIISADPVAQTITAQGTLLYGLVGQPFAVTYGQMPGSEAVNAINPRLPSVATPFGFFTPLFFSNTGPNSFAYDDSGTGTDPTPDGFCQICHSKTQHWRRDGTLAGNHNSGLNCTQCHSHAQGFKASCDTCHGNPPVVSTLGGPNGLVNNPAPTGADAIKGAGAHPTHASGGAGDYSFSCDKCHSGGMPASPIPDLKIQLGFNISPSYQSGTYDGRSSLANGYTYSPGNTGTTITQNGTQSCTNVYCHSNAKVGTPVVTYQTPAPQWLDGPYTCTACHGQPPAYPNGGAGTPTANSHVPHVTTNGFGCEVCHNKTTSDGGSILNTAYHVNATVDVFFDSTNPNGTYTASTKTCSTVTCHGSGTPQWGGSVQCQSCHLGPSDVDNFAGTFWNNGTTGIIGSSEWSSTGHGATASYASGNPAAGFPTANSSNGCTYCHDSTVGHKNSSNPFRLRNITDSAWGKNGNCQLCHAAGSAGVIVDSVLKNGTKKVGSTHFGTKHGAANNGGQFCWDCHDPHGDTNAFMIHSSVAKTSDSVTGAPTISVPTTFTSFSTGTDYAKSTAPFTGICQVCHTTTNHYTATSGDGHNSGIRCTQCHKHTGDGTNDAFKPGGNNCFDCHSSAGGPTPGTAPDAYHQRHVKTAFVGLVAAGDYGNSAKGWYRYSNTGDSTDMGCGYCHPQSSATHMNGVINLNFDPNDAGAAGTLKAKNATPQVFSQTTRVNVTCSSVYCHSNGYNPGTGYGYKTSDNWYSVTITGDVCAKCHGNSPTGSSAHAAHVVGIHFDDIYTGTTGLAAAGNSPTGSHGNAATSTTINCNICHFNTVTMSGNDLNTVCATCHTGSILKGTMAVAAGSTTHVNGTVDVAFNPIAVLSKAQLRDPITAVPELNNNWTRPAGYKAAGSYDQAVNALNTSTMYASGTKTCSNIACHNGNQVQWTSTVTCNSCHTALPQ